VRHVIFLRTVNLTVWNHTWRGDDLCQDFLFHKGALYTVDQYVSVPEEGVTFIEFVDIGVAEVPDGVCEIYHGPVVRIPLRAPPSEN
jgi:hypothetical protein